MNIYKYQILKYLENQNYNNIKELKTLSKDELINKYIKNINKSELTKYLNKRKQREIFIHNTAKQKITIDWNNAFVWL
jgi:hypothetical protein